MPTADLFKMYRCITLDPPWLERGGGKSKRGADRHYSLMTVDKIVEAVTMAEPVSRLAPDCHCWCWVTDNFLEGGLRVMKALGFRYVRTLVWVKVKPEVYPCIVKGEDCEGALTIGLGQYLRGAHELALFGVRGDAMVPPPASRCPSVVFAPKGRHSAKPDTAIKVFESVSPGPRLEMFARTARSGWDAWGNEVPGTEAT